MSRPLRYPIQQHCAISRDQERTIVLAMRVFGLPSKSEATRYCFDLAAIAVQRAARSDMPSRSEDWQMGFDCGLRQGKDSADAQLAARNRELEREIVELRQCLAARGELRHG